MKVEKMNECGFGEAMIGLSLNKLQSPENMSGVAKKLCKINEGSHRKFLRQIQLWIYIEAPVYWWCEFDTYKIGTTRQSSSTMHKPMEHTALADGCTASTSIAFHMARDQYMRGELTLQEYKANIPMGIMLKSVISLNYEVVRTIMRDRKNHRLPEWQHFCGFLLHNLDHPELLGLVNTAEKTETTQQ